MRSIGERLFLPLLALAVKLKTRREERTVRARYYANPYFKRVDLALKKAYAGRDPFLISKEFLTHKGAKDIYAYGETPLSVLEEIGKRSQIQPDSLLIDLGSGRGRGVFFFAHHFSCQARGVEWIEEFVTQANRLATPRVSFYCQNILEANLSHATHIYLYGTCLEDEIIVQLIEKFVRLQPGTKVITVSYPLSDYCAQELFALKESFCASFPWGKTDIYIQERT